MSPPDLKKVEPHTWQADTFTLDVEPAKPRDENIFATDYYEILRVAPQADEDTIERVYRTLEDRFHPDNESTGDPETFLRLREAYETLSNPASRAKYNVSRQYKTGPARFWLRGREFFDGVRGGQNRRLAVLCLLYRQKITAHESQGITILDLERLTGCTREELTYALWYLCEKKWATIGEFTAYTITADGFDVVESKLEDRLEFRALATVCYYNLPAEPGDPAQLGLRFWQKGALPVDIEPARMLEGDVVNPDDHGADHYEILGIGPHADEEDIERVYHTLAARFHPDNPSTGDAKTFLRIREAYETLSNEGRRVQYNSLRERTKYPARFRLRGREFFDGIKGEQLRRLAVLCILYRQAAGESPGLTVLDLEQLTGCTREELGSALWYLREKKWAKSGEFTEYSITAPGFDVVENKLEDRESARTRALLIPEETHRNEFVSLQVSSAQAALVAPQSLTPNTSAPENLENEQTDIQAGKPPENADAAAPVTPYTPGDQFAYSLIRAAQAVEQKQQSFAVNPAGDPPENVEVAQMPIPVEAASDIAEEPALFEDRAEPPAVASVPTHMEDAPVLAEQCIRFEDAVEPVAQGQPNVEITPHFPGVSLLSSSMNAIAEQAAGVGVKAVKRVIFSMGGKGGVGKTNVMTGLAEWFGENQIPVTLLDLDTENKARGSLTHFFGGRVPKINIHTPAGLDAFVDILAEDAPAILADMGAGAGQITHDWFDKMYPDVAEVGIVFTAIGVVTSDPASVESVLNWAAALQHRVAYVVVENHLTEHTDFTYWRENAQAEEFRRHCQPSIIRLDCRLADLENAVRNHGVTLGRVADRTAPYAELQKASLVMRAQSYRRRMFEEFDKVKELLLP